MLAGGGQHKIGLRVSAAAKLLKVSVNCSALRRQTLSKTEVQRILHWCLPRCRSFAKGTYFSEANLLTGPQPAPAGTQGPTEFPPRERGKTARWGYPGCSPRKVSFR